MVIFLLLLPLALLAGEFTASVNRNPTTDGEGVILNLTLTNSNARESPPLDILKEAFYVHSQSQSHNTLVMNGKVTGSTSWQVTLVPKKVGETHIPSISISTNEGMLSTNAITLQVTSKNEAGTAKDIIFTTDYSSERPYKNEPIHITFELVSQHDLQNIQLEKFNVDNAVLQQASKPKVEKKVIEGVRTNVVTFDYLLTPLKEGPLEIPPIAIQGEIPTRARSRDIFSHMMGFDERKPFLIESDGIHLEVKSPRPEVSPWLPAESITIEEVSSPPQLKVHEPFTRTFEIRGEGILSAQLPDLSALVSQDKAFKVYADKPECKDEIIDGKLICLRKEQYTLVPQTAGDLALAEITIAWWDTVNDRKAIATLPAKMLSIEPSEVIAIAEPPPAPVIQVIQEKEPDRLLYAIIGGLTGAFLLALIWGISLKLQMRPKLPKAKEKVSHLIVEEKAILPTKDKKEKLPDLNPT